MAPVHGDQPGKYLVCPSHLLHFIQQMKASLVLSNFRKMSDKHHLLSVKGIEMTTPFPVPTQRRLPAMSRAVIRTNEKPSFPVPVDWECEMVVLGWYYLD